MNSFFRYSIRFFLYFIPLQINNEDNRCFRIRPYVDMFFISEEWLPLCNVLLDDIDYHFDKVKCRKIEQMMPQLMKMVDWK